MLNPVVLPLPLALAILALLGTVVLWAAGYGLRPPAELRMPLPVTPPTPGGRHRLENAAAPYRPRDWATIDAERAAAAQSWNTRQFALVGPRPVCDVDGDTGWCATHNQVEA